MSNRDEIERKKLQLEIAEILERQTKSIETFQEAQKELLKSAKLLKVINEELVNLDEERVKLEKEINDLGDDATDEQKEKLKILKKTIAASTKQRDQLKLMARDLVSMKNSFKAIGNSMLEMGKNMKNYFAPSFKDTFTYSMAMDKSIRNTSASLGLSTQQSSVFRENIRQSSLTAEGLNISVTELSEAQKAYSDETGRNVLLSSDVLEKNVLLAKSLNMTVGEMASLGAEMEQFGFGAGQSADIIESVSDTARKSGMNAQKMVKSFGKNLKVLNKISFKGGVKGLEKMTTYTEKMKINIDTMVSSMEKAFNPEGAIEMASELQMMGGEFSKLGDPFSLMFDARNNPEEYMRKISESVQGIAKFKDGEFIISPYELQRLEHAGKALGVSKEEMVEMAKQRAKIDKMGGQMFNLSEEEKDYISGIADMNKDGTFSIKMADGTEKQLSSLNSNMIKQIMEDKTTLEERAKQNQTFQETYEGIKNQLTSLASQVLLPLLENIRPLIQNVTDLISSLSPIQKAFAGSALLFGKVIGDSAAWIYRGYLLRKGFGESMETSKRKGIIGGLKDRFMGRKKSKTQSTLGEKIKNSVSGGNNTDSKSGSNKGVGKQAGMFSKVKSKDLIKGAAAILILSAALFVFAKAMQELQGIEPETYVGAAVGLGILVGATLLLGKAGTNMLIGAAAIVVLSGALWVLGQSMEYFDKSSGETLIWLAAGVGTLGLVMAGLGTLIMGPVGIAMGVGALAFVALGGALTVLGLGMQQVVSPITEFTESMDKMVNIDYSKVVSGIKQIGTAVSDLDTTGLGNLREISTLLGSISEKPIRIEFGNISVDGDIELSGEGGGKTSTDWVNNPAFVEKLTKIVVQNMGKLQTGG